MTHHFLDDELGKKIILKVFFFKKKTLTLVGNDILLSVVNEGQRSTLVGEGPCSKEGTQIKEIIFRCSVTMFNMSRVFVSESMSCRLFR